MVDATIQLFAQSFNFTVESKGIFVDHFPKRVYFLFDLLVGFMYQVLSVKLLKRFTFRNLYLLFVFSIETVGSSLADWLPAVGCSLGTGLLNSRDHSFSVICP